MRGKARRRRRGARHVLRVLATLRWQAPGPRPRPHGQCQHGQWKPGRALAHGRWALLPARRLTQAAGRPWVLVCSSPDPRHPCPRHPSSSIETAPAAPPSPALRTRHATQPPSPARHTTSPSGGAAAHKLWRGACQGAGARDTALLESAAPA